MNENKTNINCEKQFIETSTQTIDNTEFLT